MEQRYFNNEEAARYLGVSEAYLNLARHRGIGPPYLRPKGLRRILYDREALDRWLAEGVHNSTAEYPTAESRREKQSPGRPRKNKQLHDRGQPGLLEPIT